MKVKKITESQKKGFNQTVSHPLQSWQWGEFRKETGVKVVRLGAFKKQKLTDGYQLTIHPLPFTNHTIGYLPKTKMPDKTTLKKLIQIGQKENSIFIKMEPDVLASNKKFKKFLLKNGCQAGRPLFTKYTFWLNLKGSEKEILSRMKSKTRYNIRLSKRKGVKVLRDNSKKAFQIYSKLLKKTTQRQGFYAHTPEYHYKMWKTLSPTDIYHLFLAKYKGRVLAAYVFFTFKDCLYYPYGASSRIHREVMPAYALFWEAVKFGKKKGCRVFDMWGTPGPKPSKNDPWYGFHRFKKGFGPKLVEFIGTYDLVLKPNLYRFYNLANSLRWKFLRHKVQSVRYEDAK